VLFFDELDSLAPARGRGSDGGGVMDRVVSQFLSELDGISEDSKGTSSSDAASRALFVIGATNRPDLLDNALLRPGRFDRLVYLGISSDRKEQLKIVRALTRKFNLSKTLNLESVVSKCPQTFTGADFYALCSLALMTAIKRRVKMEEDGDESVGDEKVVEEKQEGGNGVCVKQEDFIVALSRVTPSVSEEEIVHYRALREKFSNG
jgi:peroxin-6